MKITIQFDANGGQLIDENTPIPNTTGINGEEVTIPNGASYYKHPNGKKFLGWDIVGGQNKAIYFVDQKIALSTNMMLYAVWGE